MDDQSNLVAPEIVKKKTFTDNYYFEIIKNYKDFSTRIGRKDFCFFILINIIFSVIVSFLWWPLAIIFQVIVFVPSLALASRRLHDVNSDFIYAFIPGYNLILFLKKGTSYDSPNVYGSVPESKIKIKLLYILVSVLFVLFVGRIIFAQEQARRQQLSQVIDVPENTEASREKLEELNKISLQEVEQAQTLEEIIKAYQNARKGSQASLAGALKWISLCQTSKEIKDASNNFPAKSEAITAALEKWKELTQKELTQAQTIEDFKNVYENAPSDEALKSTIYNKWNEIALQKVDQFQNLTETKKAYDDSPKGSQAKTKILEKWKDLVSQKVNQAQSFEDMQSIYSTSPDDDSLKSRIIAKWIPLCQSTIQAKEVYSHTTNRDDQELVMEKWAELANREINDAQGFQDISYIYNNLPDDNKIKDTAIAKWISFCQTYQEAKEVYSAISSDDDDRKQEAFDKWDSLALKEIEQAQTLEAVKEIYNNTPENSTSRKTAIEKIKELS